MPLACHYMVSLVDTMISSLGDLLCFPCLVLMHLLVIRALADVTYMVSLVDTILHTQHSIGTIHNNQELGVRSRQLDKGDSAFRQLPVAPDLNHVNAPSRDPSLTSCVQYSGKRAPASTGSSTP
jgi:hypothetical protein